MDVVMKYCSHCGSTKIVQKIPQGDNVLRFVCEECHTIHYQNPKLVTGCLLVWEDKVLLCKRAIEPRYGLWTLPAGFMENNETIQQAATREVWEEAHARMGELKLYALFSLPFISQVYVMFRAQLRDLTFAPGSESLDVQLFSQAEIPWDSLAFPIVNLVLNHYFKDRITKQFPVRVIDVASPLLD